MNYRVIGVLVVVALVAVVLWRLPDVQPVDEETASTTETPRYELKDAQWTRLDDTGLPEFVVTASQLRRYADGRSTADQLELDLPDAASPRWQVDAPSGQLPAGGQVWILQGGVVANGAWPDGVPVQVKTETMNVDPTQKLLSSDAGVTVESPARHGTAQHFSANWEQQTVNLEGQVRMNYGKR